MNYAPFLAATVRLHWLYFVVPYRRSIIWYNRLGWPGQLGLRGPATSLDLSGTLQWNRVTGAAVNLSMNLMRRIRPIIGSVTRGFGPYSGGYP